MWECNEAVTCYSYVALVIDQLMVVGHWWNESDRVKPKYFDESLSKCHFFSHMLSHVPEGFVWDQM